jgi:hypothetical protein
MVTFNEAMDGSTINTNTIELRTAANALVPATVSYNAASFAATLTPSSTLSASTAYTVIVKGGAADPRVKDAAGNALASTSSWSFTTGVVGGACAAPANAIVAENCLAGNPASEWDISGAGDATIQGFATQISVNRGTTVSFKVKTTASAYRFDIYRMGYYGGMGARKVATVLPSAALPQSQPNCLTDAATGLIDCGNWAVSGSWAVPANATSGIYFARLVRTDTGGSSHIVFVVRDDASTADMVFQTSDTTWQAYNNYGGNSLYAGAPAGRAYKVSYNRPFNTRAVDNGQDWVFNAEYPMVRWLEANGYNASYISGIDTDRAGSLLLNHRVFLSVGHDEYWSGAQRSNVEAARNAGVHLAFFSANEIFWKTRWENSIDGTATPYRTLVSYKETHANAKIDPTTTWTGTWRDPRFSPPSDGGKPENALTGTIFMANDVGTPFAIQVPEAEGKMRLWRNTSVATLAAGQVATFPTGTLGYEWDSDLDNGFRPAGLIRMSSTTVTFGGLLLDYGSTYGNGTLSHYLTLYKHSSGARVFGAGTIQWPWGLDANHDRAGTPVDVRMQQATVNLLADMNAQPATLQAGLVPATASADSTAPASAISSPTTGSTVPIGGVVTISGTASDAAGGVVGGVEVSVDGGTTWRMANGRGSWTYSWTPSTAGNVVIRTRAADDSGNIESPTAGVTVTVGGTPTCPCTIWPSSAAPGVPSDGDTASVNVGVKFRSDVAGYITGIRFYKGTGNSGTHVGTLWSSSGQQLAQATFANETATGWQQVSFSTPVAIAANTVYVASYLAPNGRYAGDNSYFAAQGVDNGVLHALRDGVSGGNGVYGYAATTSFPTSSYQASNYWVDVVFASTIADTTAPTITARVPAVSATGVSRTAPVTVTFSEAMDAATINTNSIELRTSGGALVTSTLSYNATTFVATLTPSATLAASTTYTVNVKGGSTDPRVKDTAGNALAATSSWNFTTAAADTTAPTISTRTPASGATAVPLATPVTVSFSEAMDAATINTSSIELRTSGGALVPSTVNYNATTFVATLTPSAALAASTTYTVNVLGGATDPRVKDVSGNALAATSSWNFTTVAADVTAPTITALTPASGATGVSRTTSVTVTFSEAMDAATISTNSIELRNSGGTLIASTVTYNATTFVATLTPSVMLGSLTAYTVTVRGGTTDPRVKDVAANALAANSSWSFTTAAGDVTAPTITARTPAVGATGVGTTSAVTVTFSEALDAATVNTSTVELRTSGGALVTSTVNYNATTFVATLTPGAALSAGATYTVNVKGGATDPRVKDVAANALATTSSWNFTTASGPTCPCNIWASSVVPTTPSVNDPSAVNLGVKFRSDVAGFITGVRFYKGTGNTGTHIGALWTSTGTLLGSATFTNESASGWQQVNFTTPVAVTANTVYVASYLAPTGNYAGDNDFFASVGVDNGALHALANGVSGGNGVYAYGGSLAFPSSTWRSSNYWVDVVFTTVAP